MPDVLLEGSFDAAHQRRYAHVPFEVPPGVKAIHVSYDYSDRISSDPLLSGGNTLDIGLFDPRGIAPSSPGYRGWSGSHKLSFSVTETWATPAYLGRPDPNLAPGTCCSGPTRLVRADWTIASRSISACIPAKLSRTGCKSCASGRPSAAGRAELAARRSALSHAVLGRRFLARRYARRSDRARARFPGRDRPQPGRPPCRVRRAARRRICRSSCPASRSPPMAGTGTPGHQHVVGLPRTDRRRDQPGHAGGRGQWRAGLGQPPQAVRPALGVPARDRLSRHRGLEWPPPGVEPCVAGVVGRAVARWAAHRRPGRQRYARLKGEPVRDRLGSPTTWAQATERTPEAILDALRAGRAFVSRDPRGARALSRFLCSARARCGGPRSVLMFISARGVESAAVIDSSDWSTTAPVAHGVRAGAVDRRVRPAARAHATRSTGEAPARAAVLALRDG